MKPEWMKELLRKPEGEGGSGGDGGEGGGEGGDAGAAGGEGGEGESQQSSSILDFADKGGKKGEGEGGDWAAPDAVPEHLRGETADATIDKLTQAYLGARQKIGKGEKATGDEDVPESADGYVLEATGDDDKVAAEFNSEEAKPVVDAFRKAALDLGIGASKFGEFMRGGLSNMIEAGLPIGVTTEEAATISGEAELETLVKEVGAAEAGTILNTVEQYALKQQERGVFSEDDVAEFRLMAGTAEGSKVMYKLLTGEFGEQPIPLNMKGADGDITPSEAYAMAERANKMPAGAERDEATEAARAAMQKAFGTSPRAGSMRSNVL
jgi:hypothetical protein